jgi:hypothetical protein
MSENREKYFSRQRDIACGALGGNGMFVTIQGVTQKVGAKRPFEV